MFKATAQEKTLKIEKERKYQIDSLKDDETKELFYKQTRSGIAGVLFVIFCVYFGLLNGNFGLFNTLWMVSMVSVTLFRYFHATKLYPSKNSSTQDIKTWRNQLHLYAIFAGIAWMALPAYNPDLMTSNFGIYTAILLGIITGGVYSLNRYVLAYFLYMAPMSGFLIIYHATHHGVEGKILAALIAAFSGAAFTYARNTHAIYKQTYFLRTDNSDLIIQLRNQTVDLQTQKNKAELANAEKSKFLAAASHDLRQPLHSLGFYLSALESHINNDKGIEIRNKSEKSLNSLNDLLNALIGISQLDAGDVDISPLHFNFNEACKPLVEEMEIIGEQKGIKIHLASADHQVVFCDHVLMLRSMRNIIINAMKHADCNEIIINTTESAPDSEHININIRDNGKGIPESQLEAIFDEFHQVDNSEKDRRKGLGLGLAIVKRVANLQGHKLGVKSSNKGSIFSISVPRGSESFSVKIKPNKSDSADIIDEKNIMVIDDEIDVLDSVGLLLTQWQQKVSCVNSGEAALQEIKRGFTPNIIITDYNLGSESGIKAIETIKASLSPETQVVYVTGNVSRDKVREIRDTGHPVLTKPLKPQMLKNLIKQLNKQAKLGRIQ